MLVRHRGRVWLSLLLALVLFAAACGGDDDDDTGGSGTTDDSAAADVDTNASLIFGYAVGPDGMDPVRASIGSYPYMSLVYDRLTEIDNDLEPQGQLAESWKFADDGKSVEFKLRTDATFTDGTKIDAAAVKANIDRARTLPVSTARTSFAIIASIDVVNPTTVKFNLAPGQGVQLPVLLATTPGMIVNPKAIADPNVDLTQGPGPGNESGPYKLTSVVTGTTGNSTFEARTDYWNKEAGRIKSLKVLGISGIQRINAVRAGDINMSQVTGTDVPTAKTAIDQKQASGKLFTQATTLQALQMRATRPPLDNIKVRQAIQLALDKDTIATGLYSGTCEVSNQDYPKQHWVHVDALDKKPKYNLDQAKKLMTESGAKDVKLTIVPSAIYVQQAQVVQAQLKEIGITVEIIPAATQAGGPTFAKGDYDMSWAQVNSVDPAETMNTIYFNANGGLIPPAEQAEFKPLSDQLSDPTKSQDERKKIYADIAEKLYAKAYTVPVCNASQVWIHDGSVANIDDIMNAWSGLVDFRYLYKKKA